MESNQNVFYQVKTTFKLHIFFKLVLYEFPTSFYFVGQISTPVICLGGGGLLFSHAIFIGGEGEQMCGGGGVCPKHRQQKVEDEQKADKQ